MSEDGFHVHGPHDHEIEHVAAQGAHDPSAGTIAVATAIIATVAALFSYMGGNTQAIAGIDKNNAAIKKTEASDQWNFYQSKSNKQNLAELAAVLVAEDQRARYLQEAARYRKEKADIQVAATRLEAESKAWDEASELQMHRHHRWAQATTALQISIALAAMALLTKRRWLEWGLYGVAGLGVALGAAAALHA
ncbi:MAG: DUF4337 domain-containing protein [Burkholderiales bacterium]|nr:DUF4337 family protein [Burkholderiales bacterium]MDE2159496.1 DUF4337 domain-containing protein [Burkholderiales bacterium]MDE2501404.1 DUF4337 domain-containing protein [Burkholderiales bacterium]